MQKSKNIILTIETLKNSFTKTEQKIAKYILSKPDEIIYMSLTEMSFNIKVSEGSIVRFCQKLNFSGFHAFKIALAKLDNTETIFSDYNEKEIKNISDIKKYITKRDIDIIQSCSQFISDEVLDKCSQKIIDCSQMLICGVGASGNTANDAFYKFMRIGINCKVSIDPHLQAMMAVQLNDNDVLVAVSQSGSTFETVDIAKVVKKNQGIVIAITAYEKSPLTKYSDYVLLTPTREMPFESGALRTKVAQIYVLELLFNSTFWKIKQRAKENINKTAQAVEDWIY